MKRVHAVLLAALLALAVLAATFAALETTTLGAQASAGGPSTAQLAARAAKLHRAEAALRHALRKKPPALPKLPHRVSASSARVVSSSAPVTTAAPAVAATPAISGGSDDQAYESEDEGSGGRQGSDDD
jgi:hypothetical protein